MSRTRSNPLALAVLTLLHERPMHPYEMSSTLRERRKEASLKLNYGSLYSVVDSLQRRGLITQAETVRDGRRPERTVYEITAEGTAEMNDWLSELIARPAKEFPQFEAALSLMAILSPDDVLRLLEKRLERRRAELSAYEKTVEDAPGIVRLFLIEHEFETALWRAEVEFVERLVEDLASGKFEGLAGWRYLHELRAAGKSAEEIEAAIHAKYGKDLAWLTDQNEPTQ